MRHKLVLTSVLFVTSLLFGTAFAQQDVSTPTGVTTPQHHADKVSRKRAHLAHRQMTHQATRQSAMGVDAVATANANAQKPHKQP